MKFITYILFFSFSLSLLGKSNFIALVKKIKSPMELAFAAELDDEAKSPDDDANKDRSEKEESKEKAPYYLETNFHCDISSFYNCNKHLLDFYTLLFKSHFKEVVTPPPELV